MPRGISEKREGEYEELVEKFEDEGRYTGREEEVAARIVNKQRAEMGETKAAQDADHAGKFPDRTLPIQDYDTLTIEEITEELDKLKHSDIAEIYYYEKTHRDRKTLLETLQTRQED